MRASIIVALALAAGCDSRATASDPAGKTTEQKSREFETCSASSQCADELRCFDHTCRRTARSTVGDYYAALGALTRTHGDLEAAIAAYAQALGHYDAEKLALPPEIDCAYGATLAAAKAKKDHAELGARVLHRCVLAVPVGSRLREQALGELAGLADTGLDPLTLAKAQLTDVYLTKGAAKPAVDKLAVTINSTLPAKSLQGLAEKLAEADQHAALVACWQAYTDATKKDTLAVSIGAKSAYIASEYEDESGVFVIKLDPAAASLAGPEAAADTCVRQILEPALKSVVREGFTTKIALTIK